MHKKSKKAVALMATTIIVANTVSPVIAEGVDAIATTQQELLNGDDNKSEEILEKTSSVNFEGVTDKTISKGDNYNPLEGIKAVNGSGEDLNVIATYINPKGDSVDSFDSNIVGTWTVIYMAELQEIRATITIEEVKENTEPKEDISVDITNGFEKATVTSSRGYIWGYKLKIESTSNTSISYVLNGKTVTSKEKDITISGIYTTQQVQDTLRSIKLDGPKGTKLTVSLGHTIMDYNEENGHYYIIPTNYANIAIDGPTAFNRAAGTKLVNVYTGGLMSELANVPGNLATITTNTEREIASKLVAKMDTGSWLGMRKEGDKWLSKSGKVQNEEMPFTDLGIEDDSGTYLVMQKAGNLLQVNKNSRNTGVMVEFEGVDGGRLPRPTEEVSSSFRLGELEAPTIDGLSYKHFDVKPNETLTVNLLEGVTATGGLDMDLTSDIKVKLKDTNEYITDYTFTEPGRYIFEYSVSDSKGQITTSERIITVELEEVNNIDLSEGFSKALVETNKDYITGFKVEIMNKEDATDIEWRYTLKGEEVTNNNTILNFYDLYTPNEVQDILRSISLSTANNLNVKVTLGNMKSNMLYIEEEGHYYENVVVGNISWLNAKANAEKREYMGEKGYLGTIPSAEVNNQLASLIREGIMVWIGLYDKTNTNKWEWVTGEPTSYMNWSGGDISANDSSNNYANFRADKGYHGTWNRQPSTINNADYSQDYLVEFGKVGERLPRPTVTNFSEVSVKSSIDTEAPVFSGITDRIVYVGDSIDLLANIGATDNVDGDLTDKIEVTIEKDVTRLFGLVKDTAKINEIDTTVENTYKVTYTVSDNSGNQTTETCTVDVQKPLTEVLELELREPVITDTTISFPKARLRSSLDVIKYIRLEVGKGYDPNKHSVKLGDLTLEGTLLEIKDTMTLAEAQELVKSLIITRTDDTSFEFTLSAGNSSKEPELALAGSMTYNHRNGHYYQFVSSGDSWTSARTNATKRRFGNVAGHLATITNAYENEMIVPLVRNNSAWLGAADASREGTWTWVTGEPFVYTNWDGVQPDNQGGEEDYLSAFKGRGVWNDLRNTSTFGNRTGYITEYPVENSGYDEESFIYDITPPTIEAEDLSLYVDEEFKALEHATISDDFSEVDVEVKYTDPKGDIQSNVDMNIEGDWKIEYVAKDRAGNTSSKVITLTIIYRLPTNLDLGELSLDDNKTVTFPNAKGSVKIEDNLVIEFTQGHNVGNSVTYTLGNEETISTNSKTIISNLTTDTLQEVLKTLAITTVENSTVRFKIYFESGDSVESSNIVDRTKPVITTNIEKQEIEQGKAIPNITVKSVDDVDGDITKKVEKIILDPEGNKQDEISNLVTGDWTVRFTSVDTSGNTSIKEVIVRVTPDVTAPVLSGIRNGIIKQGESYSLTSRVTAKDIVDGDVTSRITLSFTDPNGTVQDSIDENIDGTWGVKYNVTDLSGNISEVNTNVVVESEVQLDLGNTEVNTERNVVSFPNAKVKLAKGASKALRFRFTKGVGNKFKYEFNGETIEHIIANNSVITLPSYTQEQIDEILPSIKIEGNATFTMETGVVNTPYFPLGSTGPIVAIDDNASTEFNGDATFDFENIYIDNFNGRVTQVASGDNIIRLRNSEGKLVQIHRGTSWAPNVKVAPGDYNRLEINTWGGKLSSLRFNNFATRNSYNKVTEDLTKPTFTGNSDRTILMGSAYKQSAIVATDDVDGTITNKVKYKYIDPEGNERSTISTLVLGVWEMHMEVKDNAGNIGTAVQKINVKLNDTTGQEKIAVKVKSTSFGDPTNRRVEWSTYANATSYEIYNQKEDGSFELIQTVKATSGPTMKLEHRNDIDNLEPVVNGIYANSLSANSFDLAINATDLINTMNYKIIAKNGTTAIADSKVVSHTAQGIPEGLSYIVDLNEDTEVDNSIELINNINGVFPLELNNVPKGSWLHVKGVDNAGKISETKHISLDTLAENQKPKIYVPASNIVIEDGEYDFMTDITATDFEDGDLTSNIEIEYEDGFNGILKPGQAGKVKYTVTDSGGLSSSITVTYRKTGSMEGKGKFEEKSKSIKLEYTDLKAPSYKIYKQMLDGEVLEYSTSDTNIFTDENIEDTKAPVIAKLRQVVNNEGETRFEIHSKDTSNAIGYYIEALDNNGVPTNSTKKIWVSPNAPIKNYLYLISNNSTEPVENLVNSSKDLSEISVEENEGKYIHVVALDMFGNKSTITSQLVTDRFETNYIPVINGTAPKTIKRVTGGKLDLMQGVTAYDHEDGDITSELKITYPDKEGPHIENNILDLTVEGKCVLTYTVTDSDGNTREIERILVIQDQADKYTFETKQNVKDNAIDVVLDLNDHDRLSLKHLGSVDTVNYEIQKWDDFTQKWYTFHDGDKSTLDVLFNKGTWQDKEADDIYGPKVTSVKGKQEGDKFVLNINSQERGYAASYRVLHTEKDKTPIVVTESVNGYNVGTLAGYSYVLDDSPRTRVDSKVDIQGTELEFTPNGAKWLHIAPIDSYGNIGQQVNIQLSENGFNNAPVIHNAEDVVISVGTYLDLTKDITATDVEDGILTPEIKIEGTVDYNKTGTYPIKYSVRDSAGLLTTVNRNIYVVSHQGETLDETTVYMYPEPVYILVNTPYDVMQGITVGNKTDGDLRDNVKYNTNLDISKVGTYYANYEVMDSKQDLTRWKRTIHVVNNYEDFPTAIPSIPAWDEDGNLIHNQAPQISAENLYVEVNTKFNILDGVRVNDLEDNITLDNATTYGRVLSGVLGVYPVTHKVTDLDGATSIASKLVYVYDPSLPNGGIPGELGPDGDFIPNIPDLPIPGQPVQPEYPYDPDYNLGVDGNGDGLPDINIDLDGDGKADLNIDTDGDGVADLNLDLDDDKVADLNIDLNGDFIPNTNVDTTGDGKPNYGLDVNGDGALKDPIDLIVWKPSDLVDLDGDGKPDYGTAILPQLPGNPDEGENGDGVLPIPKPPYEINLDTTGDGKPNVNIDSDRDGKADLNIDLDGDLIPDLNIDLNGDGIPNINIDGTGDGVADYNVDTNQDGILENPIDLDKWKPDLDIDMTGDGSGDLDTIYRPIPGSMLPGEEEGGPTAEPPGSMLPGEEEGGPTSEPPGSMLPGEEEGGPTSDQPKPPTEGNGNGEGTSPPTEEGNEDEGNKEEGNESEEDKVVTVNPDGSITTTYPDGTTITELPDGTTITKYPDGSYEIRYPDGSSSGLLTDEDFDGSTNLPSTGVKAIGGLFGSIVAVLGSLGVLKRRKKKDGGNR